MGGVVLLGIIIDTFVVSTCKINVVYWHRWCCLCGMPTPPSLLYFIRTCFIHEVIWCVYQAATVSTINRDLGNAARLSTCWLSQMVKRRLGFFFVCNDIVLVGFFEISMENHCNVIRRINGLTMIRSIRLHFIKERWFKKGIYDRIR